ncbi:BrnA antitoxin family protein [Bdellovibrio bacteriovorus]|uniref:BrnA antitoxin family protein n=1 Tax=Bdellovibrio bacteriovorus TaxID=959 RepID=UPI0021D31370|nr:BrnA antitoxin family protein [Bdellovibrio bacteriovorus]UXR64293.1 BrnA antitoxin family protein [Bdellovibrio bacteriovorus]
MKNEYDFSKAKKGKVVKETKVLKTIRLDPEILEWLEIEAEKQGMGYQTYLNWYLRKAMSKEQTFEDRLLKLEKAVFPKKS